MRVSANLFEYGCICDCRFLSIERFSLHYIKKRDADIYPQVALTFEYATILVKSAFVGIVATYILSS